MSTGLLNRTLLEFGVSAADDLGKQADAQSGAGVHPVRTAGGRPAYLKITPAGLGPEALDAARREVRFYRELAPTVAVRTPELLASSESADGVAVLLAAAGQAEKATSWSQARWAALGDRLARLHSMPLPVHADWARPDPLVAAMADPNLDEINACWADVLPELSAIVARTGELRAHLSALPPVFIHGDCHTGNIVFYDREPVLCDWQAAGIGRPVSDLAFLSVRVTPSGAAVPPDLVTAYLERRPCDRRALTLALTAEELAIFVFLWPPYLVFNTPTGIARVRGRVRTLAAQWLSGRAEEEAL